MRTRAPFLLVALASLVFGATLRAQSTAFTYQGRLHDGGTPANGFYHLQFTIYDAFAGGGPVAYILTNGPIEMHNVEVRNGLFTVTLDVGAESFNGADRWLEIAVRTNSDAGTFTVLSPRQQITSTPYAIQSVNAARALTANSALVANSAGSVSATNILGTITLAQLPSNVLTNGASGVNISGTLRGDGAGVTNISVNSLFATTNFPIVAWGWNADGQTIVPSGLSHVVAAAGGTYHSLALKDNGTVVAWGNNNQGQTNVPSGLSNVVTVAAGFYHSLALKNDGMVVAWGGNTFDQTAVPSGLSNVVVVAGGGYHNLALKTGGTVVAWGFNGWGQTSVPSGLTNIVAIAAGGQHSLALKSDGTVVAWGINALGVTNVPPGLNSVVALAAGEYHTLALKSDGTVVAWGFNAHAQTNVPFGLSNVVAVAAGDEHSLALKSDGTVVAWGLNSSGQTNVPSGLNYVIALAAGPGAYHVLAIQRQLVSSPVPLLDANNTFTGNVQVNGILSGNGSGLTNLNASQIPNLDASKIISGTIADARLSANVALINGTNVFSGTNTFTARVGIGTNAPAEKLHVIGNILASGTITGSSDRNLKENFAPVDAHVVLDRVAALPINRWNYKTEAVTHLGPMAQDFYTAFNVGMDDKHISMVDADGVALAAIQGLNQKVESGRQKTETQIEKLEAENAELKARLEKLEWLIQKMAQP